jgi:hypothetical protein
MRVKRYQFGFRADQEGTLHHLFDSGQVVTAVDYDRAIALLKACAEAMRISKGGRTDWSLMIEAIDKELAP